MPWSYSGNPAGSDRDAVRFLIGDTDSTDPLATDEELDWLLLEEGSTRRAAAAACRAIAAKYSRLADASDEGVRVSYSQKAEAYAARAAELESREDRALAPVAFAGGISAADVEAREADDRMPLSFGIGMHDNTST